MQSYHVRSDLALDQGGPMVAEQSARQLPEPAALGRILGAEEGGVLGRRTSPFDPGVDLRSEGRIPLERNLFVGAGRLLRH